jgi:hypothetical protein
MMLNFFVGGDVGADVDVVGPDVVGPEVVGPGVGPDVEAVAFSVGADVDVVGPEVVGPEVIGPRVGPDVEAVDFPVGAGLEKLWPGVCPTGCADVAHAEVRASADTTSAVRLEPNRARRDRDICPPLTSRPPSMVTAHVSESRISRLDTLPTRRASWP